MIREVVTVCLFILLVAFIIYSVHKDDTENHLHKHYITRLTVDELRQIIREESK